MPRLFALLTGVKDYHPQSGVTSLTGCVNDVNNIEACLTARFPNDRHIIKLLNEQATRQNVTNTFISHLINNPDIQAGDIVLFYYSGHGSHAKSNPAFSAWDSEGRDETLVLYDSRCNGGFDLADKELRLLLSQIPAHANTVVIIDSCHSGSITRNVNPLDTILLGRAKQSPARKDDPGRELSDYLTVNNISYEKMLDGNGKAKLPNLRCLTLSACDRTEVAYESSYSPEAVFTSSLLETLQAGPENISYARLYEQLYTLLKRRARQQTPQLQVAGGFDANTLVFDSAIEMGEPVYKVVKEADGKITVNCGALHGIKNDAESIQRIAVRFFEKDDTAAPATLSKITAVGLDKSELESAALPPKIYDATIVNLPPAVCIYVTGAETQLQTWQQLATKFKNETLAFVYDSNPHHDYLLQMNAYNAVLSEPGTGKLVKEIADTSSSALTYLMHCCNKICAWHQLLSLHNHAIKEETAKNVFNTEFGIELLNEATGNWELQPADIVLYLDEQRRQIPVKLKLTTGSSTGWYCGVYYMNSRYGIQILTNPVNESKLSKDNPLDPFPAGTTLSMRDDVDEITDYLKLVISKEPFKDFLIEEFRGFENTNNDIPGTFKDLIVPEKIDQHWYAKTLSVKMVRRSGKVDATNNFNHGKLTIHQHTSLNAKASISPVASHAKSIHPADQLRQYVQENGLELVNLDTTKSALPASIVWVDGIEGQVTPENPLTITLQETPTGNEEVLAMTMEDGIIQVIGLGRADEQSGNYTIEIPALPEDQQRKKNLVRAAWFCFVKVVLRKDLSKLQQVLYVDGKVKYKALPNGFIKPGMKVAVCIHGIIGNTKGMAATMEFLQTEKKHDAILAYDYENLNNTIEEMAENFKKLLGEAGVSSDTPIDIISHSMGGLISRYLIEHLDGTEGWVNRLFMFGTPNGGSVLGDIPKYRNWAVTVLTLACNYGGALLGAAAPVLSAVNKALAATKLATNSLEQMAIGSKFLKLLNTQPVPPVTTQYHIIAGNVLNFVPAEDSDRFQKIMEKIKRQAGELLYNPPLKNDIAVSVDSIFAIPPGINATKEEISGHHMNYFELDDSIKYFKTLL